ncbi:reverse transcriptase domain-containing protein [Tanacetum coccineum]
MNTTQAQQKALDDALVVPADRLEFGKCNMRLKTDIKPKEATFQVVLDAFALTPFYRAFLITTDFCPKIPGQKFEDLSLEHDILSFIRDLGYTRNITYLTDVNVDYLHQPWRAFATVINKCLSGKETGMDKIHRKQRCLRRQTTVSPNSQNASLNIHVKGSYTSRRNKMFWHTARDDTMFTSMRCISRHEDTQTYYAFASGEKAADVLSLKEDILKITVLKTKTSYPSRKMRRIRACTHKDHKRNEDQYAVSRRFNKPYSRYGINIIFWKISNVVPTLRNPQYACMSTHYSTTKLIPPFSNPESVIRNRQRNHGESSLLLDFEEINMDPNNNHGPPPAGPNPQYPAPDLRTMEELLQARTKGAAQTWLEKEPPNSITTWDDLVSKFVNQFFPPSRTANLRNDITNFQQKYNETFSEAWERFKDLLKKCPHHGFSLLHQIDTFYNGLNQSDQDSLNSTTGGNLLTRNTQEALTIIENKSKVQTSRNKPQVSSSIGSSSQNDAITALTKHVEALGKHIVAMQKPIHSILESYKTCGGQHHYSECQATVGFTQGDVYATTGNYNTGGNSYQP